MKITKLYYYSTRTLNSFEVVDAESAKIALKLAKINSALYKLVSYPGLKKSKINFNTKPKAKKK